MPENTIKPSEVSEVLLRQLQGIDNSLKFDEVGTVLQVSDVWHVFTACAMQKLMNFCSLKTVSWVLL